MSATCSLRDDGRVEVVDQCRRVDGTIDRAEGPGSSSCRTTTYSCAVVGHPERSYLWILSRTPRMEADLYQRLLERIERRHGYDVGRIEGTMQSTR